MRAVAYRTLIGRLSGYPDRARPDWSPHAPLPIVIRRNRDQATLTPRGRRLRDSARQEEQLRAGGVNPYAGDAAGADGTVAKQRRGPSIKAILLISLLLVLVIAVVGGILLWQRVATFNDSVSTAPAASSALWGPLGGTERVNIALFGYGGKEHHAGNYLADSIQILSIDPTTNQTTIIPIPRDFWVEGLPEIPDNGKINEAFAIGYQQGKIKGAAQLTTEVLSQVTGLKITHWLAIDFGGFKEMVDAVGGVDVQNRRFFRYTWSPWVYDHNAFEQNNPDLFFRRGRIHLTGDQALAYARARYTSLISESSDFARSERQQRVLAALRTKLGSGGIGSLGPGLAMMDALESRMKTDLSAIDLALLSGHMNPDKRLALKEGKALEATTNTDGAYILVVVGRDNGSDYAPLQRYLRRELERLSKAASKASPTPSS
jgi:LCP family protein required for cell wall assembly